MNKNILKSKKFIIASAAVVLAAAAFIFLGSSETERKSATQLFSCESLTPLVLQEFEAASGQTPVSAEKCLLHLDHPGFLIKITYGSAEAARAAKLSLVAGTEGKKKMIDNKWDWVALENDSSVFLSFPEVNSNELGILVLRGADEKAEYMVKADIEMAIKSGVMLAGPYAAPASIPASIPESASSPVSSAPAAAPSSAPTCSYADLSKDYKLYAYTVDTPGYATICGGYKNNISSRAISLRCSSSVAKWRNYFVKEVETGGAGKVRIKADLELKDHSKFFTECAGIGVKYDDYSELVVLSSNPKPALDAECDKVCSVEDWPKCAVKNNGANVLGHCGVAKCSASQKCDFEINVSGLNKIYLVYHISDAWLADLEGVFSNVQVCGQ